MQRRAGLLFLTVFLTMLLVRQVMTLAQQAESAINEIELPRPYLVKDINNITLPSAPQKLTAVNGILYFTADNGLHGRELWRSDGTPDGTYLVKDIYADGPLSPQQLTAVSPLLYFTANDGFHGWELWRSDGTLTGTFMVKDIHATDTSAPSWLTNVNETLFFVADDGLHGTELWRSDGTFTGTVMVKDINSNGSSEPRELVAFQEMLYFSANDGVHGYELWRSDGTLTGTVMVRDIQPGSGGSSARQLTAVNDQLLFSAYSSASGYELWRSDGSFTHTVQVKDIYPGAGSSNPDELTAVGGDLFFIASDSAVGHELWRSDGTLTGTVMVAAAPPGVSMRPTGLTAVDDLIYFTYECDLWRSDGTLTGTFPVNTCQSPPAIIIPRIGFEGQLYFQAHSAENGTELWTSDGSITGTQLFQPVGAETGDMLDLAVIDDWLFFPGSSGVYHFFNFYVYSDIELWRTTGVTSSTELVKDINQAASFPSYPAQFISFQDNVFFTVLDAPGNGLWQTDGTMTGTTAVYAFPPDNDAIYNPLFLTELGDALYFSADDAMHGMELWRSDGHLTGTWMLKDIYEGAAGSHPTNLTRYGDHLYFKARDPLHGVELWRSDGTMTGTQLISDINPGTADGAAHHVLMSVFSNTLFFNASDGVHGWELWRSDGSLTGTWMVKDIQPGIGSGIGQHLGDWLAEFNHVLYFAAHDGIHGRELWRSDGTFTGTVMLQDIHVGDGDANPSGFYPFRDLLFFSANDGLHGQEAWVTDGTPTGTLMFADLHPTGSSNPSFIAVANNHLFFVANDGVNGRQLWATNGTISGTHLVRVINGSSDWWLPETAVVNDKLALIADDGLHGHELWLSDGTYTGTVMLEEINPAGTNPEEEPAILWLNAIHDVLYVAANDGTWGMELWAVDFRPDLMLTQTITHPPLLLPGAPVTVTLAFANVGNGIAQQILLTQTISPALVNATITHSGAAITPTQSVSGSWAVADLVPGEGGIITITGVISPAVITTTLLTAQAQITTSNFDAQPDNNRAQASLWLAAPLFSLNTTLAIIEGNTGTITITLDAPNPYAATHVEYATVAGTAVPNFDYLPISGTLTIPPGATQAPLTLVTLDDDLVEGAEQFMLLFTNPQGAWLAPELRATAVTILDNDAHPAPGYWLYLPLAMRAGS